MLYLCAIKLELELELDLLGHYHDCKKRVQYDFLEPNKGQNIAKALFHNRSVCLSQSFFLKFMLHVLQLSVYARNEILMLND